MSAARDCLAFGCTAPSRPTSLWEFSSTWSLLHYTFSKPETTFTFIKKLVKKHLAASPCFLLVSAFSPLYAHPSMSVICLCPRPSLDLEKGAQQCPEAELGAHLVETMPQGSGERLRWSG